MKYCLLLTLFAISTGLLACKKTYTCVCEGGIIYQKYEKEVKASSESKAKDKCEADNPPPNSPDFIYCNLK